MFLFNYTEEHKESGPDVRMFGPPVYRPVTPGGLLVHGPIIPAGNEELLLLVECSRIQDQQHVHQHEPLLFTPVRQRADTAVK